MCRLFDNLSPYEQYKDYSTSPAMKMLMWKVRTAEDHEKSMFYDRNIGLGRSKILRSSKHKQKVVYTRYQQTNHCLYTRMSCTFRSNMQPLSTNIHAARRARSCTHTHKQTKTHTDILICAMQPTTRTAPKRTVQQSESDLISNSRRTANEDQRQMLLKESPQFSTP